MKKKHFLNFKFYIILPFFIFFFINVFSCFANSPGIEIPEWVKVLPLVEGRPFPGNEVRIGFSIQTLFDDVRLYEYNLFYGSQIVLKNNKNFIINKNRTFKILHTKILPDTAGVFSFSIIFKAEPPEKKILGELKKIYPENIINDFFRMNPLNKREECSFYCNLHIDKHQAYLSPDIQTLTFAKDFEKTFLFLKDFYTGLKLDEMLKKNQKLNKILAIYKNKYDFSGVNIKEIETDFQNNCLDIASFFLRDNQLDKAIFEYEKVFNSIKIDSFEKRLISGLIQNNILIIKFINKNNLNNKIKETVYKDLKKKNEYKGFFIEILNNYTVLINEYENIKNNSCSLFLGYLFHNRAVMRCTLDEYDFAVEDLNKSLKLNPWLFSAKDLLQKIKNGDTFENPDIETIGPSGIAFSKPDISVFENAKEENGLLSETHGRWYVIPFSAIVLILFLYFYAAVKNKF